MNWRFVILPLALTLLLAGLLAACDGGGSTPSDTTNDQPATTLGDETATAGAATTTLPPIGTPFQMDTVLSVSGISEVVGQGTLAMTVSEEDGKVELLIDGTAPVVNGETCNFCMVTLELGPGAVAADTLFTNHPSEGVRAEVSLALIGPMFPDEATLFIVAGEQGAVLEKEGAGFRLVEGEAWLVTDRSLIAP